MPAVSVIIPTYNRAKVVGRAVQSVLDQGVDALEIIIVDDGSTDGTKSALEPYLGRIKYLRQDNAGCSAARNAGLLAARSEWIAFLDSDDVWRAGKLRTQLEWAARHPSVGFWCGDCAVRNSEGKIIMASRYAWNGMDRKLRAGPLGRDGLRLLLEYNFVGASSVLVRKEVLDRVGEFSNEFSIAQDYDEWIRCAKICEIGVIPSPPYYEKTLGGDNLIGNKSRLCEDRLSVLLKHPDVAAAGPEIKAVYEKAITRSLYEWGSALIDTGEYSKGWSKLRQALGRDRTAANGWDFVRICSKKALRLASFGLITRERFFKAPR